MNKYSDDLDVHIYVGERYNIPVSHGETIKESVCALLNSNGGKLVLTARKDTNMERNVCSCEQYFMSVIGTFNVHKCFQISELEDNRVALVISGVSRLCTLKTNLYIPSSAGGVSLVSPVEQHALREILFERRVVEISKHEVPEQFCYGDKLEFRESKTIQFKNIRTDKGQFASRAIGSRFTAYVSGFANGFGGMIFYGIKDDATVVGTFLADEEKDRQEITEKLEKEVQNMIWPEKSGKIVRGKQWDIKFVPVKNGNDRFVIVVSVSPCSGGVFTQEPESYFVDNNEVKKMSFETWKRKMYNSYYIIDTMV